MCVFWLSGEYKLKGRFTLNLFPTLIKLSLPAFCFESLELELFSKRSRTNLSFDSHTRLSKDMWRASLFFSTNWVCSHTYTKPTGHRNKHKVSHTHTKKKTLPKGFPQVPNCFYSVEEINEPMLKTITLQK